MTEASGKILENIASLEIPPHVTLIAVSKTKSVSAILEAYESGQRDFGENYMQEAIEKIDALKDVEGIRWHFIGHLQSNKAKLAARYFHMVQSLDSVSVAEKLDKECKNLQKILPVLIEVNIGREAQKGGILPDDLDSFVSALKPLDNLDLRGFMCIPPSEDDPLEFFNEMKRLKEKHDFPILSMGMSSDYKIAIECGSTMVRIGTRIFGSRN